MNNRFNENQIGRFLPADFKCIDANFLNELCSLEFIDRVAKVFNRFSSKEMDSEVYNYFSKLEFPVGVVSLDGFLGVLELTYGKTLTYEDYIFDKSSSTMEIYSLASVLLSAYCELVSSDIISMGDKINYSACGDDGRVVLALYYLKKIGAPINAIILGVNSPVKSFCKDLYVEHVPTCDVDEIILGVYEETDYLLDPISARGMVAEDYYYEDYDDGCFTLILGLVSPYMFARVLVKLITNKNELSIDKAIHLLYLETGEIPEEILNGDVKPFFKEIESITCDDAISVING